MFSALFKRDWINFAKYILPTMNNLSTLPSTSNSGKAFLDAIKCILPNMDGSMHKGNCGRIGIIGGSIEYTGAPYFAAISAFKAGADLVHVICPKDASLVIKSYSPDLIVHPFLNLDDEVSYKEIDSVIDRLHSIVIGPGLGRSDEAYKSFTRILNYCKSKNLPIVIDADGLYFICQNPSLISGYKNAILTPNVVEFGRLYQKLFGTDVHDKENVEAAKEVCKKLGEVTVLRKGDKDVISNGSQVAICDVNSSPRRCGGQGDLLCGSLSTYFYWALNFPSKTGKKNQLLEDLGPSILASYAACLMTKECNRLAFEKYGRSTITTNMIDVIHTANANLFDCAAKL